MSAHPPLIDTHCHLDACEFDADRPQVIAQCIALNIQHIVLPGITRASWDGLLQTCQMHTILHPALGLHPMYVAQHEASHITALEAYLDNPRILAIGEIGLDFFVPGLDVAKQQHIFSAQLQVAKNMQRPVLLHARKCHDQMLHTLRRSKLPKGGIVHAFNGSYDQAQHYIQLGFKLGFGGTLTYPRANKIRDLAKRLPLDSIVLETDAPDMVTASHRGERNSPAYLPECLQVLAEIRQQSPAELALQLLNNSCAILHLNGPSNQNAS